MASSNGDPPRLELRRFAVSYRSPDRPNVVAVDRVDLRVARGESVGLLGESGCGKSSLATAAFGLAPVTTRLDGEVRLDGESVTELGEKAWRRIRGRRVGLVFQQPSKALHPLRSVGGQLRDVLRAHTRLPRRALAARRRELFAELGLEETHLEARPHQLSGGQQQRALLAIALAAEPALLVADEPTAALDGDTESRVLDLVLDLRRRRGLSLLWISHEPRVLERLCDRLYVMYAGRMVETGPTGELLARPRHPYLRALLACRPPSRPEGPRPLAERRLPTIPGEPPDPRKPAAGCRFAPRCPRRVEACDEPIPATDDGVRAVWCLRPHARPDST